MSNLEWVTTKDLLEELRSRFELTVFAASNQRDEDNIEIIVSAQGDRFGCESLARHLADYMSAHILDSLTWGGGEDDDK